MCTILLQAKGTEVAAAGQAANIAHADARHHSVCGVISVAPDAGLGSGSTYTGSQASRSRTSGYSCRVAGAGRMTSVDMYALICKLVRWRSGTVLRYVSGVSLSVLAKQITDSGCR